MSESFYQNLFKNSPCAMVVLNTDGKIIKLNASFEKISGISKNELLNKPFIELLVPRHKEEFNETIRQITQDNPVSIEEIAIKRQDQKITLVQTKISQHMLDGQAILMIVIDDITQKLQSRRAHLVDERLSATSTLAAGIAFEINNPLAYIYINLIFIQDELNKLSIKPEIDASSIEQINAINEVLSQSIHGAEKIRDIIKNLKGFTRIDKAAIKEINLHDLINSSVNVIADRIKKSAILDKDYRIENPLIVCNPGKLQQMFTQLLLNSVQAMKPDQPQKNLITIRTRPKLNGFLIDIVDTGHGIPDSSLTQIFDPFYTTKTVNGGKGLGLFISYDIVRNHGGDITISNNPTIGSKVSIYLPARRPHE